PTRAKIEIIRNTDDAAARVDCCRRLRVLELLGIVEKYDRVITPAKFRRLPVEDRDRFDKREPPDIASAIRRPTGFSVDDNLRAPRTFNQRLGLRSADGRDNVISGNFFSGIQRKYVHAIRSC